MSKGFTIYKRLVINGRFLGNQIGGTERYATEILSRMNEQHFTIVKPKSSLSGGRGFAWDQFVLPSMLRKNDFLINFSPLGPVSVKEQLIVIHDMAPFDHPEWFSNSASFFSKFTLKKLVKKVRAIVTISEFSKQRIIDNLGVSEDKIFIIYPGVSSMFLGNEIVMNKSPYILCYGAIDPRKNINRAIHAWNLIKRNYPNHTLKIIGKASNHFNSKIEAHSEQVEHLGYVSDVELTALIKKAALFLYPSLYEGFGLPVAESLASYTPVVASDIPVFRELFDGLVTFVDPLSVEDISRAIETTLDSRQNLLHSRSSIIEKFNYDSSAFQFNSILETVT